MHSMLIATLTATRVVYGLSFLLALPLFWIMWISVFNTISDGYRQLDEGHYVGMTLFFLSLLLGYVIFKVIPDFLKKRTLKSVESYKVGGFKPQCEIVSSITYDSYLGFDLEKKKAFYFDKKKASFIDFDKLNAWRLEPENTFTTTLKLLTLLPSMPVIKITIPKNKSDEWEANLGMIFS